MILKFHDTLPDLLFDLQEFLVNRASSLPKYVENNLYTVVVAPSPVDKIVNAAEIFYAARFELDKDALAIGAQLAMFAYANGWGTMRDRGASIALSMQREAGFESASGDPWPKSDNDLAPLPQFEASEE